MAVFPQFYYSAAGSDHDIVKAIKASLQSTLAMVNLCHSGSSVCADDKVEVYLGLCKVVSKT